MKKSLFVFKIEYNGGAVAEVFVEAETPAIAWVEMLIPRGQHVKKAELTEVME